MERKIGEIFEYNGEWYQCLESTGCYKCDFYFSKYTCTAENPHCTCRSDHKNVVYKKLEKVGDPFISGGKLYQHYKVFDIDNVDFDKCIGINVHNYAKKTITAELKQNQEDMEEKKLNLKPFDLQKAREGKSVCTRDGRKVRIICFDKKCLDEQILIALVNCGKEESMYFYTTGGKCIDDFSNYDLMMLPEKKEGWIIVSKNATIYDSLEKAKESFDSDKELCVCKAEWEE